MSLTANVVEKYPGAFVVILTGSIDSVNYPDFEEGLAPVLVPTTTAIILDMSGITHICSMGLGIVSRAQQFVEEKGGRFMLANLQPQVKKVFEIVKYLGGINVFASIAEADDYLDKVQKGEI